MAEVRYTERRRFAKVLHDDIAQEIMAAAMISKVTCEQLKAENHPLVKDACLVVEIMERVTDHLKSVVKSLDTPD